MGQRHQIYLALPHCNLCNGTGIYPDMKARPSCNGCAGKGHPYGKVVGLHHQWLYGTLPPHFLGRVFQFIKNSDAHLNQALTNGFENPAEVLKAIYQCDPSEGYYHSLSPLEDECADPRLGDNNDGITVIDLRDPKSVGYCFMFFDRPDRSVAPLTPLTAKQYVEAYYPPTPFASHSRPDKKRIEEVIAAVDDVLIEGQPARLLTVEDLAAIFPAMADAFKVLQ